MLRPVCMPVTLLAPSTVNLYLQIALKRHCSSNDANSRDVLSKLNNSIDSKYKNSCEQLSSTATASSTPNCYDFQYTAKDNQQLNSNLEKMFRLISCDETIPNFDRQVYQSILEKLSVISTHREEKEGLSIPVYDSPIQDSKNNPIGLTFKVWHKGEYPYIERNLITADEALTEYVFDEEDLLSLKGIKRRSPYSDLIEIETYYEKEVRELALKKHGSMKNIAKKRQLVLLGNEAARQKEAKAHGRRVITEKFMKNLLTGGTKDVIIWAIMVNFANVLFKGVAYFFTRSPSMFSEMLHSIADTVNQMLLGFGVWQSHKKPSSNHPYGYAPAVYATALLSAVSTFGIGGGCSIMTGITALFHNAETVNVSLTWAVSSLLFGLITEAFILWKALRSIENEAMLARMTFFQYLKQNKNPSCNLLIIEDLGAVLGNLIALIAISFGPRTDCFGSILIGTGLCCASVWAILKNFNMLIPTSIPESQCELIKQTLEEDPVVRGVYDVKTTDIGGGKVRFKAEIDLDSYVLVKWYLEQMDMRLLYHEIRGLKDDTSAELFLQEKMQPLVEQIGGHFDRMEKRIKKNNPEVRHADLEPL